MDIGEICVGEYVRTCDGIICRVVGFNKDKEPVIDRYYDGGKHLNSFEIEHYVVNHSKNKIDLIQCGDYVNGYKITNKIELQHGKIRLESGIYAIDGEIKSIVTKEQYKSVEYVF